MDILSLALALLLMMSAGASTLSGTQNTDGSGSTPVNTTPPLEDTPNTRSTIIDVG